MLSVFSLHDQTSKQIYFKINSSFGIFDPFFSPSFRLSGLYAIYIDEVCLYVGQSGNLASRITDHITGRYDNFSKIEVYTVCDWNFPDFYERTKGSQKAILENNEAHLINRLKPTENKINNRDADIGDECLFVYFTENPGSTFPQLCLYQHDNAITICSHSDEFFNLISPEAIAFDENFWRNPNA